MNRKSLVISLGVLVLLAAGALYGVLYGMGGLPVHDRAALPQAPVQLVAEKAPKAAPEVAFGDAAGGRHALADFKGHYVLLNLWATWCAPCVSELPALAQLQAAVPGLKVVAVDVGKDKAADADAFLKSHKAMALGNYVDNDIVLERAFGAYGLPVTVLIDPKGNVVARTEGPAPWSAPDAIGYFKALVGT